MCVDERVWEFQWRSANSQFVIFCCSTDVGTQWCEQSMLLWGIQATFIHCLVCERASNFTSSWICASSIMEITTEKNFDTCFTTQHKNTLTHTLWPTFYCRKSLPHINKKERLRSLSLHLALFSSPFLLSTVLSQVPMEPDEEILFILFYFFNQNNE